jgi:acetoin utilization deacetylase AcuC-like enzyme
VLTISLHQDGNYPAGRGLVADNGEGAGAGANVNIPLPSSSGTGAYVSAFERVVVPALERFRPELVLIASGLDAAGMDPLGRQLLHSGSYRELTRLLLEATAGLCDGRLVAAHEGGYDPVMSPFCGLAILETLSGERTDVVDPWEIGLAELPEQELLPHHRAAVDAAAVLVEGVPTP